MAHHHPPRHWREKFDPQADYIVSGKGLLFGGRQFQPGEDFDVPTTERQKRCLYDSRHLEKKPKAAAPPPQNRLEAAGDGLFNVKTPDGQLINPEPLPKDEAMALAIDPTSKPAATEAPPAPDDPGEQSPGDSDPTSHEGQDGDGSAGNADNAATPATQPGQETGGGNDKGLHLIPLGYGWYNVEDGNGKVVNEKKLRFDAAQALIAEG